MITAIQEFLGNNPVYKYFDYELLMNKDSLIVKIPLVRYSELNEIGDDYLEQVWECKSVMKDYNVYLNFWSNQSCEFIITDNYGYFHYTHHLPRQFFLTIFKRYNSRLYILGDGKSLSCRLHYNEWDYSLDDCVGRDLIRECNYGDWLCESLDHEDVKSLQRRYSRSHELVLESLGDAL